MKNRIFILLSIAICCSFTVGCPGPDDWHNETWDVTKVEYRYSLSNPNENILSIFFNINSSITRTIDFGGYSKEENGNQSISVFDLINIGNRTPLNLSLGSDAGLNWVNFDYLSLHLDPIADAGYTIHFDTNMFYRRISDPLKGTSLDAKCRITTSSMPVTFTGY